MFLGIIIIVIGLSVLLGAIFGINIPIFKVLLGLFFLYLGIKVIFGSFNWKFDAEKRSSDHEAIFSKSEFQYPNNKNAKEYVTVFGSSQFDLSRAEKLEGPPIEVVTVFGESRILVKKGAPLRIESNTVFAGAELPGKNISAFGKFQYATPGLKNEDPALELKVTTVFGHVIVEEKD